MKKGPPGLQTSLFGGVRLGEQVPGREEIMDVKLTSFAGQYKRYFLAAPILTVVETSSELLLPLMMGKIVDEGIRQENRSGIFLIGAAMLATALGGLLCGILSARFSSRASQGYGANLRQALFEKIQEFSFADIDSFSTASLVTRCTTDARQIQEVALQIIRMLVRAPALLVVSLLICLRLNRKLSCVYLAAVPVLFLLVAGIMHATRPLYGMMQRKIDALNASVQENMIGIRVVKTFVRTALEKEKFRRANDAVMDTAVHAGARIALMHPCSTAVFNATAIGLYWVGGHMVGSGELLSGELLTFISYLNNIMFSVMMFTMVLTRLSRVQVCLARCREVLTHEPDIRSGSVVPETVRGSIRMEHVSFRYPGAASGTWALSDVTLDIAAGEFVAIIGPTGCGKTTLVHLIPRFYDAAEGCVQIDGRDVRDYDLEALRSHIGIVLQNNRLFSGTIRENLLWGAPDAGEEELLQALRDAQAEEFVLGFPDGLDTRMDQGGVNVSGGQKQRLCIARALLKRPAILILDDATSAVDSTTEARLRAAFRRAHRRCTVLLVTQKISSVREADRIVVLDKGAVHAVGTHEQLLRSDPVYQEICRSQQEGGEQEVEHNG